MNASLPAAPVMVWHIFRKDWKLLWPLAVGLAACQGLLAVLNYQWEPYAPGSEFAVPLGLLSFAVCVGMGILIIIAVQQDSLSSVRQDWLTRPIRRGHLLLAKILFVLLVIHGPIVVIGLLHGLCDGFAFGPSLVAALARNAYLLLIFTLPLLTIAALTASVTEVIVGSLAIFVGIVVVLLLLAALRNFIAQTHHWDFVTIHTDIAWVWQSVAFACLLLGMAAAIILQYFRRMAGWSRVSFIGALLMSLLVQALPWEPAFAVQRWLSANPTADRTLAVAFDPSIGPVRPEAARNLDSMESSAPPPNSTSVETLHEDRTNLYLPLRFSGLPADSILHADRSLLRLIDSDGKTIYRGTGRVFQLSAAAQTDGQATLYQVFPIPNAIYRRIKDEMLRLEIGYSLTLLRSRTLPPLSARDGEQYVPGFGRCAARINDAAASIQVGCVAAGEFPPCVSLVLEHPNEVRRDAAKAPCTPDYAPFRSHFSLDALSHFNALLPLRETHHPIDETQLHDTRVAFSVYETTSHFSRDVIVSRIRPQDWQAPQ